MTYLVQFDHMGSADARLRSIVGVSLHTVNLVAEDGSYGSGVASQFVGNDPHWFGTLATQEFSKEPFCGALITIRLDQNVDHVPVLIDGTPQILLQPVDSNKDLIQVPVVAEPALSSLQFPSIVRTEFLTPLPDRPYDTMIPRSARRSSTSRKLRQKRW
jgi:hypothetical protein